MVHQDLKRALSHSFNRKHLFMSSMSLCVAYFRLIAQSSHAVLGTWCEMNSLSCKVKDVGITLDIRTNGDVEDGMRNRSYTIPTSLVSNIEGTE